MNWLLKFYPGDGAMLLAGSALLQATVVVAIAWLLGATLARRNTALRYALYLAALAVVLASPLTAVAADRLGLSLVRIPWRDAATLEPGPARLAPPPSASVSGSVSIPEPRKTTGPRASERPATPAAAAARPAGPPMTSADILRAVLTAVLAVWIVGAFVFLARIIHGWGVLTSLRRELVPLDGRGLEEVLARVRAALGVSALPPILTSRIVGNPITVGLFKPAVVLPAHLPRSLPAEELADVLVHECAHVVGRDYLVGFLQRMVEMLYWPLVPVHLLNRRLSAAREELCDNFVLRQSEPRRYARCLVSLAEKTTVFQRMPATVGLVHPRWRMEERIRGIVDSRRKLVTRINKWVLAGLGLVFLGTAVVVAACREEKSSPVPDGDRFTKAELTAMGLFGGTNVYLASDGTVGIQDVNGPEPGQGNENQEKRYVFKIAPGKVEEFEGLLTKHNFRKISVPKHKLVPDEIKAQLTITVRSGRQFKAEKGVRTKNRDFDAIADWLYALLDVAKAGKPVFQGNYDGTWRPAVEKPAGEGISWSKPDQEPQVGLSPARITLGRKDREVSVNIHYKDAVYSDENGKHTWQVSLDKVFVSGEKNGKPFQFWKTTHASKLDKEAGKTKDLNLAVTLKLGWDELPELAMGETLTLGVALFGHWNIEKQDGGKLSIAFGEAQYKSGVVTIVRPAEDAAAPVNLKESVGKKVTLTGVYSGPGKGARSSLLLAAGNKGSGKKERLVHFEGRLSGEKPAYGQTVRATGVLKFAPDTPDLSKRRLRPGEVPPQVAPAHYYFDEAAIEIVEPGSIPVVHSRANSRDERGKAVFDGFRKISLPADSAAVGKALGGAPWLAESVLSRIDDLGGLLPIEWNPMSDTVFCLYLLPDKAANVKRGVDERWSDRVVYFRLSGKSVSEKAAAAFLRGKEETGTKLLEFALCTADGKTERFTDGISWGQPAGGLRAGIVAGKARAGSQNEISVTGLLRNVAKERLQVDTFAMASAILALKVYRDREAPEKRHLPTLPPPMPPRPGTESKHVVTLAPGKTLRFEHTLNMFSPALKPGRYWAEFRYRPGVKSPRVEVEIVTPPDALKDARGRAVSVAYVVYRPAGGAPVRTLVKAEVNRVLAVLKELKRWQPPKDAGGRVRMPPPKLPGFNDRLVVGGAAAGKRTTLIFGISPGREFVFKEEGSVVYVVPARLRAVLKGICSGKAAGNAAAERMRHLEAVAAGREDLTPEEAKAKRARLKAARARWRRVLGGLKKIRRGDTRKAVLNTLGPADDGKFVPKNMLQYSYYWEARPERAAEKPYVIVEFDAGGRVKEVRRQKWIYGPPPGWLP